MSRWQKVTKRVIDILISFTGLICVGWVIIIAAIIAKIDTKITGFFMQKRVGKNSKFFNVIKIRTMSYVPNYSSYVTTDNDPRVSRIGNFLRKSKIDELPQLINVLIGDMSLVGPRPDLPGFADKLVGKDRIILSIRPGITGPASLKYSTEEKLLANVEDPIKYNMEVVYPDKVKINRDYIENYTIARDFYYIFKTVFA